MTTSKRETWHLESRKRQVRAMLFNCSCRGGGGALSGQQRDAQRKGRGMEVRPAGAASADS